MSLDILTLLRDVVLVGRASYDDEDDDTEVKQSQYCTIKTIERTNSRTRIPVWTISHVHFVDTSSIIHFLEPNKKRRMGCAVRRA